MAEQSDSLGAVRPKFPKFTKKPRPRAPTPEVTTEVQCRSDTTTSPLTPLPHSRSTNRNAHTSETPHPGCVLSVLKRSHFGQSPDVCGPWDGKVASHGPLSGFVITTPTQHFVPQLPKDVDIINTYIDGRWGVYEYSRHPQWYMEDMMHVACIPRNPSPTAAPDVLFLTLQGNDHWVDDPSVAVNGLGRIHPETRSQLQTAANVVIDSTATLEIKDEKIMRYRAFLVMLLRQVVSRMNYLPAVASRAIAIAAHVQRLCLELAGLKTYVEVVLPRIESSQDFSRSVLDVVGGFLREGAVTQTWHRVGIPYWVLQPLTEYLVVYKVVAEDPLPFGLASERCDPPILQRAGSLVGVTNLTGSWVSKMVLSVSTHIAGSHLAKLNLVKLPEVPATGCEPSQKKARVDVQQLTNGHLRMRPAEANDGQSKAARRRKRRHAEHGAAQAQAGASTGDVLHQPNAADIGIDATGFQHPSRTFFQSAFIDVSDLWSEALSAHSPVPQTTNSALYFFPPPFLLDTVGSASEVPSACPHPKRARVDTKVNRYLHNHLRIREFCRLRLFDVSLENRPLSIVEWRAALWGDYTLQTSVRSGGQGAEARRAGRHLQERNRIIDMFRKVARMDTYNSDAIASYEDREFDLARISTDVALRQSILWELHEVNFRAELIALDAILVQTGEWQEIHRWEREMEVSGVWGPPTSGATVVADTRKFARTFCWYSPPHELWEHCRDRLRQFTLVLTRWPDCPDVVIQAGKTVLDEADFAEVQRQAVRFYVRMFVSQFARLPIPPVVPL